MKLTLIRHTSVDENFKNCYNGHNNIGLSAKGKEEAKKLAHHFQNKKFDAIFCSDLARAKETLSYFEQKDITFTKLLREKSWGRHEGMKFEEILKSEDFEYENFLQWIDALDGEDYALYIKRVKIFFLDYLPLLQKQNILIMTHAGVIRVLYSIVQKLSLEEAFSINFGCGCFVEFDLNSLTFKEITCV